MSRTRALSKKITPHTVRDHLSFVNNGSSRHLRIRGTAAMLLPLIVVALAMTLGSCSPKKNTAASRNYQAFLTRYNVYFNGNEHYKVTLKDMEENYEDEYSSGAFLLHPAEAYNVPSATKPSGSFTRSIEKAQKAIQLHSIKKRPARKSGKRNDPEYKKWLKRDEYNPFLHNAWMMMGRSQYMGGDFIGAASTFYYISKHFTWLPATVTEARLWEARSYCAMDWLYEAEAIITRIKPDQLTDNTLKGLYAFTSGDLYLRMHDYDKAIPYLSEAARLADGAQKPRLYMILGRACISAGRKAEAWQAFKNAGKGGTPRSRFNARIKQSEVYEGADIKPEVNALKRMTRYGSYKNYLDQIYYAIGNLYLSRGDTVNAIANYELAAKKSTRNGIDKAISQATLGNIYFNRGRYDKAQPCYAEAVPQLPETYPGYEAIKRRSDVLDELAVYSQNVTLNDSLLRLAALPEAERLKVIDNIISELKKKEKEAADDAKREEYLSKQNAAGSNLRTPSSGAPQEFSLNTDKSWYFYNTATRNAGRTDFQRRWGARKLEDDWRRHNKASFSIAGSDDDSAASDSDEDGADDTAAGDGDGESASSGAEAKDAKAAARAADPHYPEYYLAQIPVTPEQVTTANDVIQEGLYNCGLILKDKLEDFDAANAEWDKLMDRYPDNVYRLDVLHNRYLMLMRQGRKEQAEALRLRIIDEFPESKEAVAMRDPDYLQKLRVMEEEQEKLYAETYGNYLNDRNDLVHQAYRHMESEYPLSPLMPRFMFLHALAYVTENRGDDFAATLRDMLERYPDAEPSPVAAEWFKGVSAGRKLHSGSSNARGMLWDIRLTNDSTGTADGASAMEFTLNPDDPHYLVMLFSTDDISPNRLLYEVARHNFTTFTVKDFDLEVMNFGRLGLLIIKGFDNLPQLNHYRSLLAGDESFTLPGGVRPVEISKSNFETLLHGGGSFDDYFRFIGEETVRETHESVLPPDEFAPVEEMFPESYPEENNDDSSAGAGEAPEPVTPAGGGQVMETPVTGKTENPAKSGKTDKTEKKKETPVINSYPLGTEGDEDD